MMTMAFMFQAHLGTPEIPRGTVLDEESELLKLILLGITWQQQRQTMLSGFD